MPTFFEKSVTKRIAKLVSSGLSGVRVETVASEYTKDALCVRVHVTHEVFTDTTLFGTQWWVVARCYGPRISMPPESAVPVYEIGNGRLSIEQIADGVLSYHRQAWVPLQGFVDGLIDTAKKSASEA